MKHIFVINPLAGKVDSTKSIKKKLENLPSGIDYEIYVTKEQGDGTRFVKQWCDTHPEVPVRFYACGGDGTINEVVSGMVDAPLAELTCYPCGSGNDYIKYYGKQEDYFDIMRLINGIPHRVDVMKVNNRYSINVCDFGFDAEVCRTMIQVKRKPIIGGSRAYTTGIVKGIFSGRKNYSRIYVDGERMLDGKMLLCTLSNGKYVGGAYKCAPLSKNDDGLVEVSILKPVRLLTLARMIGVYSRGEHFEHPLFKKVMLYRQGKEIEMAANNPFYVIIDGEVMYSNRYRVENLHQAVTFVSPCEA